MPHRVVNLSLFHLFDNGSFSREYKRQAHSHHFSSHFRCHPNHLQGAGPLSLTWDTSLPQPPTAPPPSTLQEAAWWRARGTHVRIGENWTQTWTLQITTCDNELDELPVLFSFPGMLKSNPCSTSSLASLSLDFLIHKMWKTRLYSRVVIRINDFCIQYRDWRSIIVIRFHSSLIFPFNCQRTQFAFPGNLLYYKQW